MLSPEFASEDFVIGISLGGVLIRHLVRANNNFRSRLRFLDRICKRNLLILVSFPRNSRDECYLLRLKQTNKELLPTLPEYAGSCRHAYFITA